MKDFIVAASGFMIPMNSYFKPFEPEDTAFDTIFNRSISSTINTQLIDFYRNKNVYRSDTINKLLEQYQDQPTFENYMNLLNVAIDIFKEIDFSSFFKLQATNTNLSNMSRKFCLDCMAGKFFQNYRDYAIVPFNIRFVSNNAMTTDKVKENIHEFEKQSYYVNNWETFLTELSENNRDAFVTFFKYIFADYY